jgi:dihydropteroate synthase
MLTLQALAEMYEQHRDLASLPVAEFTLGTRHFSSLDGPALMGVVNMSADSWYRESVCLNAAAAIRRGLVLHQQGAALIDLGAESSLAQAARLDEAGQENTLLPVVRALAESGVLVSVETYHPQVTQACLAAGAKVLNLTGSKQTEEMFRLVADHQGGVIICFVEGDHVRAVSERTLSDDPIPMLYEYFARKIEEATRRGVTRIWIDPGLGFYYKNLQDSSLRIRHQIQVFLHTFRLRKLGWPICQALPHAFECFEDEVRSAEPFFAVLARLGQTDLLRTHELTKVRGVLQAMSI